MQLGVIFPQTEIGADPKAVRDFVQAAEEMGYAHLIVFDHVLGADTRHYANWQGPYTKGDLFHEPFVLYGYLAALTQRLELVTAVIILGQRQTALVAKQAAEVDVLSGGRLRLGVGIGWNAVEYEALNENFHDRGKRCEEQIAVLRALWTRDSVDFQGRWHHITHAGINPQAVVERVGRLADGWFPQFPPDEAGRATLERMRTAARAAGRDPASIGIEGRISVADNPPDTWSRLAEAWGALGATHLSVNTMRAGLKTPTAHIDAMRRFYNAMCG
jgi:probable F420-dependent oxidoreductase